MAIRTDSLILPAIGLWLIAIVGAASAGENWPQFRGPRGDGQIAASPPTQWSETENVVWKTAIHGRGWSSPVVWDGRIWLTTATDDGLRMSVLCVDAETGDVLLDKLLFENESVSEIHSYNSYASPTPVIEGGRIYVSFGSYGTACLDTSDGRVLWQRRDFKCEHYRGPGSSPILFGDLLILHFDGFDFQYVVALDKLTGETVWRVDRDIDYGTDDGDFMKAFATPQVIDVDGKLQLISPTSKAILAYDPYTGDEIWRVRHEQFSTGARPLYAHGLVYVLTGHSRSELWAIRPDGRGDVTDTHVVWRRHKNVGTMPSPVIVGDLILLVNDGGIASCVEAVTGKEMWMKRLGGNFAASPVAAGDNVYFTNRDGTTTVVRAARKYEEVAQNKLDQGCMASFAPVGDDLIVRTITHLYRIGER